jgi:hypothetical protein
MTQQYNASFQKLGHLAIYAATVLVGLCWAFVAQGYGQMVIGLYERGCGRINAVVFFVVLPLAGLVLSVGMPIWLQRNGRTWLALTTVLVSVALLGWGVLSFFRAAGI